MSHSTNIQGNNMLTAARSPVFYEVSSSTVAVLRRATMGQEQTRGLIHIDIA